MFRFRRLYSSIPELHKSVKEYQNPGKIIQNIPKAFENFEPEEQSPEVHDILKSIQQHDLIDNKDKVDILNQILVHALPHDYSLYFTINKGGNHLWDVGSLSKLIEANPGRVDQSWDLLKKYGDRQTGDLSQLYEAVLDKLLFGEKVEIRDEEIEMNIDRISRGIFLSGKGPVSERIAEKLVELLVEYKVVAAVYLCGISNAQIVSLLTTSRTLDSDSFLVLFDKVFREEPSLLDKETLCRGLTLSSGKKEETIEVDSKLEEISSNLGKLGDHSIVDIPEVDCATLTESILQYIESNKLDKDKSADSLLIRMKLIEIYGMDKGDVQTSLSKFHDYQGHDKFGIEFVQHKLISVFCFQAINEHNEHYLKIAQTLMTMENIPIKILQVLILARSEFDSKTESGALDLYNEYINQVSKKLNEVTKRSGAGQLTEAMILASLYTNDREFGQLLFDKAVESKIISDELEIATIKKLFKVYGDAFADDSWDIAKEYLKKYVLEYIRRL